MCRGCVSGKFKGLTIVTTNNQNYQNLDDNTIKNLDKNITDKVSTIHNIPLEYLLDKDKFALLEPFINVHRLLFLTDKNFEFDNDNFFIEPQVLPNELALFQNLEELVIYTNEGEYSNCINCSFVYDNKMLIFDGDSQVEKFQNIPQNIKYLNIIPTSQNLKQTQIEEIYDYNFLPNHIEELHLNSKYLLYNSSQTNLPFGLNKLKSNVHRSEKFVIERLVKDLKTYSKIPHKCELKINEYA